MEMTKKALKVSLLLGLVALIAMAAGIVSASGKAKGELPEYLGSQACLGCHAEKFVNWDSSGHAHMLTEIVKPSDLPGDMNAAPAELKAELEKADWIVAGQRFLARDPATGELKYLNVRWNVDTDTYVAYKGGASWDQGCAGCHSTGWSVTDKRFAEPGIGCEMCHGPGREHVLGKGDVSQISVSTDADVCGQCHMGGKGANGESWPLGYRPGMTLTETFKVPVVDPHGQVPSTALHWRQYPLWQASAHATALPTLQSSGHGQARCTECHSADAIVDEEFDPNTHKPYNSVTCVACHDPHNSTEKAQLRMDEQALCVSCHTAEIPAGGSVKAGSTVHHPMKEMLDGYGAIGVAPIKGAHSGQKCVECHMTEGNHLMAIIKPEDVIGTTRKDTCTSCHAHEDSSAESRAVYLEMWQDSVGGKLEAIKADVAKIDAALKANPNALTQALKDRYAAAKTNYTFVDADGSKGAHNFEYTIRILNNVRTELDAVKAGLK